MDESSKGDFSYVNEVTFGKHLGLQNPTPNISQGQRVWSLTSVISGRRYPAS